MDDLIVRHWDVIKTAVQVIGIIVAIIGAIIGAPKMITLICNFLIESKVNAITKEMDKNRSLPLFQHGFLSDISSYKQLSPRMQKKCIEKLMLLGEIKPDALNSYLYSHVKFNNFSHSESHNPFGRGYFE